MCGSIACSCTSPVVLCTPCQGEYAKAGALYKRCQAIDEKVLGPEHPSVATTLHNRAGLLEAQVRAGSVFVKGNLGLRMEFAALRYRVWGCGVAQMRAVTCVQGRDGVGRLDLQWRRTSGVVDEMCPWRCRSDVGVQPGSRF